jgi:membrane protease YdiL (CAAX protease family)
MGVAGGAGSVVLIVGLALLARLAVIEAVTGAGRTWANTAILVPYLGVVLLFGAVGEELLFHGYAFQLLVRHAGAFATVLPVGILFGLAHLDNENVTALAIVNTIAWGVLLGCAYLRTRALWMSIGLHFGWNAAMPLVGLNLSGFKMEMTGYALRWRIDDLWSGGAYGLEGGLFTTLIVSMLFFLLYRVVPGRAEPDVTRTEYER